MVSIEVKRRGSTQRSVKFSPQKFWVDSSLEPKAHKMKIAGYNPTVDYNGHKHMDKPGDCGFVSLAKGVRGLNLT